MKLDEISKKGIELSTRTGIDLDAILGKIDLTQIKTPQVNLNKGEKCYDKIGNITIHTRRIWHSPKKYHLLVIEKTPNRIFLNSTIQDSHLWTLRLHYGIVNYLKSLGK